MNREEFIRNLLKMGYSPREAKKKSNYERFMKFLETGKIPPAIGRPALLKIRQNFDNVKEEIYGV